MCFAKLFEYFNEQQASGTQVTVTLHSTFAVRSRYIERLAKLNDQTHRRDLVFGDFPENLTVSVLEFGQWLVAFCAHKQSKDRSERHSSQIIIILPLHHVLSVKMSPLVTSYPFDSQFAYERCTWIATCALSFRQVISCQVWCLLHYWLLVKCRSKNRNRTAKDGMPRRVRKTDMNLRADKLRRVVLWVI